MKHISEYGEVEVEDIRELSDRLVHNGILVKTGVTTYRVITEHECEWVENQEIDFYMDDREQIYLLRIRNNDQNSISFYDDDYNPIRYIVVQMRVIDTYESLRQIIRTLKKCNYKDRDNKEIICISVGE